MKEKDFLFVFNDFYFVKNHQSRDWWHEAKASSSPRMTGGF